MIARASGQDAPYPIDLPRPPLADLARIAIFADLDGTLADIQATPDAVGPDGERRRLLDKLEAALDGRFAVVSGRSLADLDRVLEGGVTPMAAVHGLIRRTATGEVLGGDRAPGVAESVAAFESLAATDPGLLVEDKTAAAALHFRRCPDKAGMCTNLAERLASEHGLLVQTGDMVVEVRACGPDKGGAVRAFMREAPFVGATPIFIGDDFTDEHGFEAAKALGGFGVVVGPRRPTAADFALPDVAATRAWLRAMLKESR